jgi:hypothetical protein
MRVTLYSVRSGRNSDRTCFARLTLRKCSTISEKISRTISAFRRLAPPRIA